MKKIIPVIVLAVIVAGEACAMNIDSIKLHFLNGNWKAAIAEGEKLLSKATSKAEGLDELYYYLALCYYKDGNYLRASDICEIILNEFPKTKFREQAHFVLIDAYAHNNDIDKARACAQNFLKEYPVSIHRNEVENRLLSFQQAGTKGSPCVVSGKDFDVVLSKSVEQQTAGKNQKGSLWVQVGAFSSSKNAGRLADKLRAESYKVCVVKTSIKGSDVFKVRVGPYPSIEAVKFVSEKLRAKGYPTRIVP